MDKIIEAKDITVSFNLKKNKQVVKMRAVDDVSLTIRKGEMLGIIGESGSGKSTLAFALLNLIESPGEISSGEVLYFNNDQDSVNLLSLSPQEENKYRWKEIATVFQAAQSALNPTITVEEHFKDTWEAHEGTNGDLKGFGEKVERLIQYVRLEKNVLKMYPFELSGGMKQRVLIALSLLLDPKVIILDEPTTALDVITQWYILDILKRINQEKKITIIFLTHDISIVSSMVDRIVVMYAGQIVEIGNVKEVVEHPGHPYTQALLKAIPTLDDRLETRKSIKGSTYNMLEADGTCRFKNRCALAEIVGCDGAKDKCDRLFEMSGDHAARCRYAAQDEREEE